MSGCNCHEGADEHTAMAVGLLERPRYSPGLILEDSDLTAAVDYTRDLNRLLFRSLFGCGVICGLDVSLKEECGLEVTVNPGLGLDGCGDPIHLTGHPTVTLGKREGVIAEKDDANGPECKDFWIIACNREKSCAPRNVVCDGDDLDGSRQNTRIRSGVEISVSFEAPECGCGCAIYDDSGRSLDDVAKKLRQRQQQQTATQASGLRGVLDDADACHKAHYTDPGCAEDCGCGTACGCGCCIVLGWAHWFGKNDKKQDEAFGWKVLHYGVRRFVRPMLIADPLHDYAAMKAEAVGTAKRTVAEPKPDVP